MFTGLSAFPLTPLHQDQLDQPSFIRLITRLVEAEVDSITVLGSTGAYPYLSTAERAQVAQLAVEHAQGVPVFVGVGALRTSSVLTHVENAERAGAEGVLLAPMTYQPLTDDDVVALFRTVTENTALPVIVYDNPGTTHFTFTGELYARVAALPGIASIKIPGVPSDPVQAQAHVAQIRASIPAHVTIGVSGDASAAAGLNAGCDAWYSVIGGTLPEPALSITHAAQQGLAHEASAISEDLSPLWQLFAEFGGSMRVVAAIAEHLCLVQENCLPLPLQGLNPAQRDRLAGVISELGLAAGR